MNVWCDWFNSCGEFLHFHSFPSVLISCWLRRWGRLLTIYKIPLNFCPQNCFGLRSQKKKKREGLRGRGLGWWHFGEKVVGTGRLGDEGRGWWDGMRKEEILSSHPPIIRRPFFCPKFWTDLKSWIEIKHQQKNMYFWRWSSRIKQLTKIQTFPFQSLQLSCIFFDKLSLQKRKNKCLFTIFNPTSLVQ